MNQVSERVKTFFEGFNRANNSFDPEVRAPFVRDLFVGASPDGVIQAMKKEDYLATTAKAQEYLHALGFQWVHVVPEEEIPLSPQYVLVKTRGTMRLERTPGQQIDLSHDASYILFVGEEMPQIVLALSHEDPMKMARDQYGIDFGEQASWDETI
uniref:Uncharacterized protein n=1 Tax=Thermosporothrix sp. COM3 TaxID=2490863 RepID=A0A455SJ79_9CHLR|nr:hypothetical protein KTC_17600 [Thermosporothrix sp. COM3]